MRTAIFIFTLVAFSLFTASSSRAQAVAKSAEKQHRVVFEVSVDGLDEWQSALRNLENVQKALGAETLGIVVVCHGKGLGMLLVKTGDDDAAFKTKLTQLHASGVVFAACQNTLRREKLEKKDLQDIATTVPSGVTEVILKQEEGFAYIKSGN